MIVFEYFLFVFVIIKNVNGDWPSSDQYGINLLGLFPESLNISNDLKTSLHSQSMFISAIILSQRYQIKIGNEYLGWKSVETGGDSINALRNSCLSVSNSNILGIIGPGYSSEAHVISPFAKSIGVPVISYGATNPDLSDRNGNPGFYRTISSDNTAALALAQLFVRYNWTSCFIIYQNDAFGSGGADIITNLFNQYNLTIVDSIVFDLTTNRTREDLSNILMSSSVRIVILWALPQYASIVIQNALNNSLIGVGFTWICSTDIPLNNFDEQWNEKLIGLLSIEAVVANAVNGSINKTLLNDAYQIWKEYQPLTFPQSDQVDPYALFAFDATWTLIQSLNQFCSSDQINSSSSCLSMINTSFCFDKKLINSDKLYDIIDETSFLGVSGLIEYGKNTTDRTSSIYYIIKNLQKTTDGLKNSPVLVWSTSNGWNTHFSNNPIVWPGNSSLNPSGYASVYGVTLRIAITETAPFTIVGQEIDEHGQVKAKYRGYVPDLIEALRMKMGFIPNITLVKNKTFNEIVNLVGNNAFDMFVAQTTITAARREMVGFSNSIFDNSLRIITRRPKKAKIDFLSYLKPFSLGLWLTILSASIVAGFLICLIEQKRNEALQDISISSLISMSMWFSVGTLVGYGVDFHVTTAAGRLLTLGLYILSLVLVAAYTANLASSLTISKTKDIISGINDIKNGKLSFSRIGILVGSSLEDFYLREVSGGNRNFYPIRTRQEIYDLLLENRIDASIMDAGVVEYMTNNVYCNLTLVGTDFGKNTFGIAFPKKWLYQQELDVKILSLRESGLFDSLRNNWFKQDLCDQSSSVITSTAMTIESMAGLFLTFAIISLLAVLLFAWLKRYRLKTFVRKYLPTRFALRRNAIFKIELPQRNSSINKSISYPTIYL